MQESPAKEGESVNLRNNLCTLLNDSEFRQKVGKCTEGNLLVSEDTPLYSQMIGCQILKDSNGDQKRLDWDVPCYFLCLCCRRVKQQH